MPIVKSILIFILAGLCEIGGGYLIWIAVRQGKSLWYALLGAIILAFYGYVATLQQQTLHECMRRTEDSSLCFR